MWLLDTWTNYTYCTINNMFTPEDCKEIIKIGKSYKSENGTIESGNNSNIRKSNVTWLPALDAKNETIYRKVCDAIISGNQSMFGFDLTYIEDLQFTEYNKGSFYKSHKDAGFNKNYSRKLSFILQLTDSSEYEGGDLVLYDSSISEPCIADREIGTITLFPSYLVHEVTPITKGKRHSLVGWVNGPRFK